MKSGDETVHGLRSDVDYVRLMATHPGLNRDDLSRLLLECCDEIEYLRGLISRRVALRDGRASRYRDKQVSEGRCVACSTELSEDRFGKQLCTACAGKHKEHNERRDKQKKPSTTHPWRRDSAKEAAVAIAAKAAADPKESSVEIATPCAVDDEFPIPINLGPVDSDDSRPESKAKTVAVLESRIVNRLAEEIREYLHEHDSGATIFDIVRSIGCERKHAANALHEMPDVLHESGLWRLTTIPSRNSA